MLLDLELVNARSLYLECDRVLLVPVLTYGSKTKIWKKKTRIRAVHMDNLKKFAEYQENG